MRTSSALFLLVLLSFIGAAMPPIARAEPLTLTDERLDSVRGGSFGFFRLTEVQLTPDERAAREARLNALLAANPRPPGVPAPTVTIKHVYTINLFGR